ncbi:MAG: NADH-ubiquinone oxidoreductase chain I, partial [uncultured Sphingomonadaceae bacterium]
EHRVHHKGVHPVGLRQGPRADAEVLLQAEGDDQLPVREAGAVAPLPRRACAAPLPERRGAVHRLQALRGGVSGDVYRHRGRAARGRVAPHHALRHRHDQVHLLRLLPGSLPGGRDRDGAELRIFGRDARGAVLRQAEAARQRRSLGDGATGEHRGGCAVPL